MPTTSLASTDSRPAGVPGSALRISAYAAATWSVVFGVVHVYWLFGGRVGLPDGLSVTSNVPLLVIDILAIPACAVAAALALAIVQPWGTRLSAKLVGLALWGTTAILLVHPTPSVPDWVGLATGSREKGDFDAMGTFATFLYEPFFLVGGVLFGLATLGRRAMLRQQRGR
ncbi:DUF3995 domain-containing protein [Streptomyces sp. 796.1]|uniref:DUF3995 domain-containing protein n=1 Tax=Streptomyces sp. 796.1 TaxID=3163029 RepID=UPI0039C9CF70